MTARQSAAHSEICLHFCRIHFCPSLPFCCSLDLCHGCAVAASGALPTRVPSPCPGMTRHLAATLPLALTGKVKAGDKIVAIFGANMDKPVYLHGDIHTIPTPSQPSLPGHCFVCTRYILASQLFCDAFACMSLFATLTHIYMHIFTYPTLTGVSLFTTCLYLLHLKHIHAYIHISYAHMRIFISCISLLTTLKSYTCLYLNIFYAKYVSLFIA